MGVQGEAFRRLRVFDFRVAGLAVPKTASTTVMVLFK